MQIFVFLHNHLLVLKLVDSLSVMRVVGGRSHALKKVLDVSQDRFIHGMETRKLPYKQQCDFKLLVCQ